MISVVEASARVDNSVARDSSGPVPGDDALFPRHAYGSWDYSEQAISGVLERMKMEFWGPEPVRDDDEQTAEPEAPSRAEAIRVFLLDDDEVVREAVLDRLAEEGDIEVVGACGGAAEAIELILDMRPDVAVLDYKLLDGDGVSVCEHVRSVDGSIRVLMLTAADDLDLASAAMVAGAGGYRVKEDPRSGTRRRRSHCCVRAVHVPHGDVSRLQLTGRAGQGRTSNTRLNGVSVARRKRVSPPEAMISAHVASGTWAPRV